MFQRCKVCGKYLDTSDGIYGFQEGLCAKCYWKTHKIIYSDDTIEVKKCKRD